MKIYKAYFSATNTTKTIISAISEALSQDIINYNLTNKQITEDIQIESDSILLVGMPVYGGRIPSVVVDTLKRFKGRHTPVILIAVYGNREFEDVFVEMNDLLEPNGFFTMAAGAFIAQHSIFPHTAKNRPDEADFKKIKEFATLCRDLIEKGFSADSTSISLPGNRPYKIPGAIPLKIHTSSSCTKCHLCTRVCPTGAIPFDNPLKTDYDKCIHCCRCIHLCPVHARTYDGLLYKMAGMMFHLKNSKRKEPQFFF